MKRLHTRVFPVLIIFLVIAGCNVRTNRTVKEIQVMLDSLKGLYAPDTRIAYWKPEVSGGSGFVLLHGEVGDEMAYRAIIETVPGRFPEIAVDLRLLPEVDGERLVSGLINNSVANIRSDPGHRAEMATQAMLGTPVRILKESDGWYLVRTPNLYLGWLDEAALHPLTESEAKAFKISEKVIYDEPYGFSYSEPDEESRPVSDLVIGCILPVVSSEAGFYRVVYPDGRMAWVKGEEVRDMNEVLGRMPEGGRLVETALKFNGIPYLWGGTSSKAVDCSGFTSLVYFMNGIILMRDANQQSLQGEVITTEYSWAGLLPGDLLFFGQRASEKNSERVTHVAIYMGDTQFIHASGRVRINSMDPDRDNFLPEYPDLFVRAVRITGEAGKGSMLITGNPFYKEIIKEAE